MNSQTNPIPSWAFKPFTVFIPVYNEEEILVKNIRRLVEYLNQFNTSYEILIGSNGSTDRTVELGEALQKEFPNIRFFHIHHRGPGAAFKKGVLMASYEHIISVDMDLSVDLNFIRMANSLLSEYDVAVGSKRMGSQKRSFIRKLASASFIFCAMILLGLSFDDYSLAAKAYKKKVLEGPLDRIKNGSFYVIQILYHATIHNFNTVQIPVACHDERKSKFNLLHEGFYRFGNLFRLWWSK